MANMNDVAKLAGVSKSTVSKVLNNYPSLSDKTIRRVMDAINELGYVPNQTASSLSKKDFKKVGIIFKVNDTEQTIDEVNMQYILGIDEACSKINVDYSVIFARTLEHKTPSEIIAFLRSKSITALVVLGLSKDDENIYEVITSQAFPAVVTEVELVDNKISCVGIDNYQAQYQIAEMQVIDSQVKKVLYISGKDNGFVSEERMRAINDVKVKYDLDLTIASGNFSEVSAYNIVKSNPVNYDAIICASDLMAIGASRALFEDGKETIVTGFDGISLLKYVGNNIHTVKQNFHKFATESVHQAINMQNGAKGTKININYEII
ncbi:LacI family DNA-binding transcriptional regulator [Mollicutes bacterium LVI A0039]|nr:LacI family DNA-binding transcriptional regulator [Mollicutes bacterium LVI A0039]